MKKFIMTFLVAGLLITSALSLSSCKKTDTSANANNEEWIPTVCNVIAADGLRSGGTMECYYCGATIYQCFHAPSEILHDWYYDCPEHSHYHCFDASGNCTFPGQVEPCPFKGVRTHRHIITYHDNFTMNSWHVGGGVCP
jgi:hypothetical protein